MNKVILAIVGLLLTSTACNTPSDNLVNCDFDQQAMLTNYADEIIIPRFADFETGLILLEGSFNAFEANPTIGLMNEIKVAFGAAYNSYQDCSPLGFGPGLINGVSFRERFNTFPTNTSVINSNIANGLAVNASPTSTVGFPAIDYLLFGESGMTDTQVFELYTTDANAGNRRAYLGQLIAEMKATTEQINDDWANYRSSFIANTGNAAGSSLSLLVNEFNFDYETLKNFKFKIPLGKFNGGVVIPASVEAYYAGGSVQLAKRQLSGLKRLYLGVGENGSDGLGLYEYVKCVKPLTSEEQSQGVLALADDISEQFLDIEEALDHVPDPLAEALVNNKQIVDGAYTKMQMMVPVIKHEMTSALGVQISYQDNDGD